jgi:dTDP-4-amino-4,6-dideoxygalactose transaminase
MNVPFFDMTRQYSDIREEIDGAVRRVCASGRYIGGEELERFEAEAAAYASVRFAVGLSSGTDALLATLLALGVGEGDEVITTPFTFIATAEVIAFLGAAPVFVDVREDTFNMDLDLLEAKITPKTKCIMPVHLFGQMSDMHRINEIATQGTAAQGEGKNQIAVVEDAAQAIGATIDGRMACGFGTAGCLSFFPSKNLGAFGDGGMVLTNSEEVQREIRIIKEHGSSVRYRHSRVGINGRLDALQAAVLRIKLKYLDALVERRREHAAEYDRRLGSCVSVPECTEGYGHVYNQYTIRTEHRDELRAYLAERGIPTAVYYPIPLHLQEVFGYLGYREGDFPVSESLCKEVLSLPIFPELSAEERTHVIETIIMFFDERD